MGVKKPLLSILSLGLALSIVLAGCSGENEVKPEDTKNAQGNEEKTSTDGRQLEGNLYLTGLPIVKDKYTFKMFVPALTTSPDDMDVYKKLEQDANVDVEWDIVPWEQQAEKRNLMFVSGEYDDVVAGWGLEAADVMKYGPQGVYIPLEQLIEKYSVNIKKMLADRPDVKKAITAPDGHIYTLPIVDTQPNTTAVLHINKKWLENVGLPKPTNTEELYTVLKAFKEKDPNKNNKKDELPLSFMFNGDGNNDQYGLFGFFGRIDRKNHIMIENNKILYTAMHPEWKEAIKYMNRLWKDGLIDPEVFTHDVQQYEAKGKQEPVLYGVTSSWDGTASVGEKNMAEYEILTPVQGPNGVKPSWPGGDPGIFKTMFAITSAAKQPEAIIRWVDQYITLGSMDGLHEYVYGPKDVGWSVTEDGKFNLKQLKLEEYATKWGNISLPMYLPKEVRENIYLEPGTRAHHKSVEIQAAYEPYVNKDQEVLNYLWMTEEQQKEISVIGPDIQKLTNDNMARWITGNGDIEADWDKFQEKLKEMGVQKLLDVYQAALDSYNKS